MPQRSVVVFAGLIVAPLFLSACEGQARAVDTLQGPTTPARRITRTAGQLSPLTGAPDPAGSWPSFRGIRASGVADGQHLPDAWDGTTGTNILWRVPIPGLAHSSPIVWGDRVFVTTAVSNRLDAGFKPGLYGAGTPADDRSRHRFLLLAIDTRSGKVIWERVAYEGDPVETRHIKNTYASATPATDGRIIVAWFGSQGVYAYNMDGTLRWKVDLGHLDVGAYNARGLEWGTASSPIIWNDLVFLQCDTHADSFVMALNAGTGELVWKSERVELPSWGTPTVVTTPDGSQLVTNGSNFIRSYEPRTGKELWRLGRSSQITAPTPIFADALIVVSSGRAPERPIFVVRPSARGDITLPDGATTSDAVVWSRTGRGPYMPTPLAYGGVLYVLGNNGVFHAYRLATGDQLYETRVPHLGNGFSSSPVAADGKIYVSGEDGDVMVVSAGATFSHIATNSMGEPLMATPALSGGVMFVRTSGHLFAVDQTPVPLKMDRTGKPPANVMAAGPPLTFTITARGTEHGAFVGTWTADIDLQSPMTVNLAIDGNRVTGTWVFTQTLAIEVGAIEGNRISFQFQNPSGERTIKFTGVLKGDQIDFVRTVDVPPGAPAGGRGMFGVGGVSTFVANRQNRD